MAELAIGIIPLGIKACSGLWSYLSSLHDYDEDVARLSRQARAMEEVFRQLKTSVEQGRLDLKTLPSSQNALDALEICTAGLHELQELVQKLSYPLAPGAGTQVKVKAKLRKMYYPLRQSQIVKLQNAMNAVCTSLQLAVQSLQIDIGLSNKDTSSEVLSELRQTTNAVLSLTATMTNLSAPVAETTSVVEHEEGCGHYLPSSQIERSRGVRFAFSTTFIKKALELSFYTKKGAGGFNISPGLTCFHITNEGDSPAFLLISYATMETMLKVILHKLRLILLSRKSNPMDVDSENNTLLHHLALLPSVTLSLIWRNAPERPPCGIVYRRSGPDVKHESPPWIGALQQGNTEAFHGPLITAILQNDFQEVKQLVNRCPVVLQETNTYGQTPFHVACNKSKIFDYLLKRSSPLMWVQKDDHGHTALGFAMMLSGDLCNRRDVNASECPCTSSVRALLAAGCPIMPHHDFWTKEGNVLRSASRHCRKLVPEQLRLRRRELKQLARNTLEVSNFSHFLSKNSTELDVHAIQMDRALRAREMIRFGHLSTFLPGDIDDLQGHCHFFRTVYYDLPSVFDAEIYFDLGFQEFDIDTSRVHTSRPLPMSMPQSMAKDVLITPSYALWLRDHHVPIAKMEHRIQQSNNSAFIVADNLGYWSRYDDRGCYDASKIELENWLSRTDKVRQCCCLCSQTGCTPLDLRIKWLAFEYERRTMRENRTLLGYADFFLSYVTKYGMLMTPHQHVSAVRQITFSVMDLKHICPDRPDVGFVAELSPDEIQFELESQETELLERLEYITAGALAFFFGKPEQEMPKREADSKDESCIAPKGNDCHYDATEQQIGTEHRLVVEYWYNIWVPKMQELVDNYRSRMEHVGHDEEALAELGVVLTTVESSAVESDDDDDVGEFELKWEGPGIEDGKERESRMVTNFLIRAINTWKY
ncbi:hypothetical protein FSARC_10937 [Fusarium sarcochroum]|uniref:Fungal N-terminal domain-containing protein n=1 Tax=Fusarium sarcochroum TaxID=1208366 RepID=A0A8H4TIZ5_9HYPO|nr:hypothetical protein FSARC_10937 [Fusarium sarcochroum]